MIKLKNAIDAQKISELVNGQLKGDNILIDTLASPTNGENGAVGFIEGKQLIDKAAESSLSLVLVNEYYPELNKPQIVVDNVRKSWRVIAEYFLDADKSRYQARISESACIHPSAKIGKNVYIGEYVTIGEDACIGNNAIIESSSTIGHGVNIGSDCHIGFGVRILARAKLGERCRILSNAVIGERGFGNVFENGAWFALPQLGSVILGNDVEVGASTMIDCGTIDDTIIGNGVKLDNLIQIAHNVIIGDHTAIAGCAVVAGSVTFGKYCVVGGASVFNGHITICDGAQFAGHSSISKSITEPGVYASGIPVMPVKKWRRFVAKLRMLGK